MSEEALKKARAEAKTLRTRLMELRRDTPKRDGLGGMRPGPKDSPSSRVTSRSDQIQRSLRDKMEVADNTSDAPSQPGQGVVTLPNRHTRSTHKGLSAPTAAPKAGGTPKQLLAARQTSILTPAPRDCILDSKYRDTMYRS